MYLARLWFAQLPYPPFSPSVGTFVDLDAGRVQAQVFHIRTCGQGTKYGFQYTIVLPFANRAYTDCLGPYSSGSYRHCAPLRVIQSIPFSIPRSSFRGRPRFPALSGGNSSFMRSHCPFVISYRFMSLFLHERSFCTIFIFQTRPNRVTHRFVFLSFKSRTNRLSSASGHR